MGMVGSIIFTIFKLYMVVLFIILVLFTIRHYIFSINRLLGRQRRYYQDIYTSTPKKISVLVPMYNEEAVLEGCLNSILQCDYDHNFLEIIPIDDHSSDRTPEMVDEFARKYPIIHPIHRDSDVRGKPAGLNDALEIAQGEIIIVFDADYRPAKNLIKDLSVAFEDPAVGAVMGRVIPYNAGKNILTRLINIERSGGYQVDQQARYNLNLVPQYGGTVGGFRYDVITELGGFDPAILAEDTELTFRLYTNGYKVVYANCAECYEESPETWKARGKQIRRWARGHDQVMFHYLGKILSSKNMKFREKVDGLFLLILYIIPVLLLFGQIVAMILFLWSKSDIFGGWWVFFFLGIYCSFGNFAPFYQIGTALLLNGERGEIKILPMMLFNFYFYGLYICLGFKDAVFDKITGRTVNWDKTARFREKEGEK